MAGAQTVDAVGCASSRLFPRRRLYARCHRNLHAGCSEKNRGARCALTNPKSPGGETCAVVYSRPPPCPSTLLAQEHPYMNANEHMQEPRDYGFVIGLFTGTLV